MITASCATLLGLRVFRFNCAVKASAATKVPQCFRPLEAAAGNEQLAGAVDFGEGASGAEVPPVPVVVLAGDGVDAAAGRVLAIAV